MSRNGTTIICLACGYKWKTKWRESELTDKAQCVKCWGYSVVTETQYRNDLRHIRKIASTADLKKFLKIYDYLTEKRYIRNVRSREKKFRKLLEDLSSLSDRG